MNSRATGLGLSLAAFILWAWTHRFLPLHGDAELYAFQALAKIHPALSSDVYLAYNSQDRYTVFPYVYAFFIAHSSLQIAALGLFVFCTALAIGAAYFLVRNCFGFATAWLTIGLLIVVSGHYGAFEVFSYFEDYLTARSLAVALISLALALYMNRYRLAAVLIAALAMLIHPIMAVPGLLLLFCMTLPVGVSVIAALLSCAAVFVAAYVASHTPAVANFLPLMGPEWLEVVQERSQFLFLDLWRSTDWELAARAFITLTLAALIAKDVRVKKFCVLAMLIGASGLTIAWIAGSVGPVAILVQGQAWRWTWITTFVAVLLIAPTAVAAWRSSSLGPLASSLLILGWLLTFSTSVNLLLVEIALIICVAEAFLNLAMRRFAIAGVIERIHQALALEVSTAARIASSFLRRSSAQSASLRVALLTILLVTTLLLANLSLIQTVRSAQTLETAEFTDWQSKIPPTSNVLMVPPPTNAAFVWIALNRPSYMSLNQSSGVVFAPATALEIRRRSEVLLPIADPDWKIRSRINARNQGKPASAAIRSLSAAALATICGDPQLGFVISKEELNYPHSRHDEPGPLQNWNLYDCRQVRPDLRPT